MDRAVYEQEVRTQTPSIEVCDAGECRQYASGDGVYEAWIVGTVDAHIAGDEAVARHEAQRELRRQVRVALAALDTDIERLGDGQGMTAAQMRPIVLRMARIERGLIQTLIDHNLIEREG